MLDEQPSVFPSVIRMSFETLQCETLCAGSLYVLMLPVLALLYLRAHRHQFKTKRKLILRFGLIFSGYASHRWYWEIIVLLRKVVLILIVTFGKSNQSQLHFSLGSLVAMLYLQERGKPFHDEIILGEQQIFNKERAQNHQLHLVEIGSLVVLCIMSWVAVFFTLTGSETIGDLVLSFLVITSNVVFFLLCGLLGCQKYGQRQKLKQKLKACCSACSVALINASRQDDPPQDDPPHTPASGIELAAPNLRMNIVVVSGDESSPSETACEISRNNTTSGRKGDRKPEKWNVNPTVQNL